MTDDKQVAMRAAFEKVATEHDLDLNTHGPGYSDCNTDYSWVFWQAATAQATAAQWMPIKTAPKNCEIDMWSKWGRIADCAWGQTTYGREVGFVYEAAYDCNGPVIEL